MACYTVVELVNLDDTALNRRAREALGLPLEGALSPRDAARVRTEAGVLKAIAEVKRQAPTAIIRRRGNELQVQVNV